MGEKINITEVHFQIMEVLMNNPNQLAIVSELEMYVINYEWLKAKIHI